MGERTRSNYNHVLLWFIIVSLVIFLLYWLGVWWYYDDWKKGADFGNAFGAANALFSGLALGVLIFAIYLQQKELGAVYDELTHASQAQEKSEAALKLQIEEMSRALEQSRKNMESDILMKLFETYRASRERHINYDGPELLWSWGAFHKKYPLWDDKQRSHEWRLLADYGGFFELCGILSDQKYIGDNFVKVLPRAKPLWEKAQEIIQGARAEMGQGLWGSWEHFAKRQEEVTRSYF